jgi:FkbM family methyltransferase
MITEEISHLGRKFTIACHNDDYITSEIHQTGTFYEIPVLETIRRNFPSHQTVVDIGSNIGNHALFFLNFLKLTRLVCFEPYVPSFNLLKRNLGTDAELHNVALGECEATCEMNVVKGNLGMCDIIIGEGGAIQVKTLDSYDFQDVTLLKIDVENSHLKVIRGALATIRRCRPVIWMEADFYEVFPLLQGIGYVCAGYWHLGSHNLLFVPLKR